MGTNVRGVKADVGESASRTVIASSACWLINLALARVPPPSILVLQGGGSGRATLRQRNVGPLEDRTGKS